MRFSLVFVLLLSLTICALHLTSARAEIHNEHQVVTNFSSDTTTKNYVNPERGFYEHSGTYDVIEGASPLSIDDLINLRQNANITLILRLYYLKSFRNAALTTAQLDLINDDMKAIRDARIKALLRFAYSEAESEPDAPMNVILNHIDQLAPIFTANYDIIAAVQAGFIGAWGEWYYSSNGLRNTGNQTILVNKLLSTLHPDRSVQVRTPNYKMSIYNLTPSEPLNQNTAYTKSNISRTGHHNDCFLASSTDYGTFSSGSEGDLERAYLGNDTKYTPNGGETCAVSPYSTCDNALVQLARFHFTYLNKDYNPQVLRGFETGGCMDEIKARLGYRISLVQFSVSTGFITQGATFDYELQVQNTGFAAPINPRILELALFNASDEAVSLDNAVATWVLPHDARFWIPELGVVSLSGQLTMGSSVPVGKYKLYLRLADAAPTLQNFAEYAVRFANTDANIYDPSTGYHSLMIAITVTMPLSSLSSNDNDINSNSNVESASSHDDDHNNFVSDAAAANLTSVAAVFVFAIALMVAVMVPMLQHHLVS